MRKAYRVSTLLEQTLEICRWVYNDTLALRKNAWEQEQRSISLYETNKILTEWKKERPDLNQVYSQVLQNVQMRVDLAFKAFFRRVKAGENPGYPGFKGKGRSRPSRSSGLQPGSGMPASRSSTIPLLSHRRRPQSGSM
jgi:putative transposase